MSDILHFLKEMISRPIQTGALVPSSPALAREMVVHIPQSQPVRVTEVGCGSGAITEFILERMLDPTLYLGLEPNPEFQKKLRTKFPQAKFIQERAQYVLKDLPEEERPDYVICSLPWSFLPRDLQVSILKAQSDVLKPSGVFSTFLYPHAALTPTGKFFLELLNKTFGKVERSKLVWRNVPPAWVYHCSERR